MSKQKDQQIRKMVTQIESLMRYNEKLINKTHILSRELEIVKEKAGLSDEEMDEIHKEALKEFQ